jgi:hypothetical protein
VVGDPHRVLLGELGQGLELLGAEPAEGHLDALHPGRVPQRVGALGEGAGGVRQLLHAGAVVASPVVIALAVDAPAQAGLVEDAVLQLALALERQLRLEDVDFPGQVRRHAPGQVLLPAGI